MENILIKTIIETIYNLYILFQFISFVTFFNLSLAYDNDFQYYITKFESNNNDSPVSNNENKEREIVPIASYNNNSDVLKMDILTENKNKTGIYIWTNNLTNKSYIGSAIDLSNRLKNYYNISYLEIN